MKHYVFLTMITGSGGVQCYNASKAKYLESIGWRVVIISDNNPYSGEKCLLQSLDRFLPNGDSFLGIHPFKLPVFFVNRAVNRMVKVVGPTNKSDEIIVESWDDKSAFWGELLASRLHARHIFWTANEYYRGSDRHYEDKIDFFLFKMDRGEIFASLQSANHLFEGYRTYKEGDFIESPITEDPIQDYYNREVESLKKADYNICYIGRTRKPYFSNIVKGVKEFALNHHNRIQFIIVGEVVEEMKPIISHNIPNLSIVELGDQYPLPRSLYKKIDVIIAGSGSARHSADEGALVITADPISCISHGLLGYDTIESVYKESDVYDSGLDLSFSDALERALILQSWRHQENNWVKSLGVEACTDIQFEIINNATKDLIYYDKKKLLEGKIDWRLIKQVWSNNIKLYVKGLLRSNLNSH